MSKRGKNSLEARRFQDFLLARHVAYGSAAKTAVKAAAVLAARDVAARPGMRGSALPARTKRRTTPDKARLTTLPHDVLRNISKHLGDRNLARLGASSKAMHAVAGPQLSARLAPINADATSIVSMAQRIFDMTDPQRWVEQRLATVAKLGFTPKYRSAYDMYYEMTMPSGYYVVFNPNLTLNVWNKQGGSFLGQFTKHALRASYNTDYYEPLSRGPVTYSFSPPDGFVPSEGRQKMENALLQAARKARMTIKTYSR